MRIKVELHPNVVRFIRQYCTGEEVDAFYRMLRKLSTEPIRHSEHWTEPGLSRYMLRLFRFMGNLAVFKYYIAEKRIRVLSCRKVPPRPRRKHGAGNVDDAP